MEEAKSGMPKVVANFNKIDEDKDKNGYVTLDDIKPATLVNGK